MLTRTRLLVAGATAAVAVLAVVLVVVFSGTPGGTASTQRTASPSHSRGPVASGQNWSGTLTGKTPAPNSCSTHGSGSAILPDRGCTQGVTDRAVTPLNLATTTCAATFRAARVAPAAVSQLALPALLKAYGIPATDAARYRVDLLIPAALGGLTDYQNLWPVLKNGPGAVKAQTDAALVAALCSGRVGLQAAQVQIAADWVHALNALRLVGPNAVPTPKHSAP